MSASVTDGRTIYLAYQPIAQRGESVNLQGAQPLVLVLAVLPALLVLGMNLGSGLAECGDARRLPPLRRWIKASLNLRPGSSCSGPSLGQGNLTCRTQADVAALAVFLYADHPRSAAARSDR
jgi:hypothetical protein